MAIDATTGATSPTQTQNQNQTTAATDGTSTSAAAANDNPKVSGAAAVAAANQQLNVAIVQSALTVSLSTKNDPLSLVYKSAIENINEQLKPTLGDNAIQNAASQDNSPEGTAGRIVSLSTGLFELYKKSFPNEDEATVLDRFVKVIQGGIDQGFKEARGILQGMGVLDKPVGDATIGGNIDKTYTLVTQGLADFVAATKAKIAAESGALGQADGSTTTSTSDDTDATSKAAA
jgi:hypothetical protein